MTYQPIEHVVILGNGIAGITTARHIRKFSDKKITVISGESDYFFSRTALMYVYMGHMLWEHTQPYENWFWEKNQINLVKGWVKTVDAPHNTLVFEDGKELKYDTLVIATGSVPNKFGWPGQDLDGVQGLYSKQDLELLEANAPNKKICKRAVIVGGGLIGIELAEMLTSREIPVTFLVREKSFWSGVLPNGESTMVNEHIRQHGIDLRLEVNLKEILADEQGRVKSIVVKETGEEIPCDMVGFTAGVSPNINFLKGSGIETNKGVLVTRYLRTNLPNVYALGDCAEQREAIPGRAPIEAVWYTARIMGEALAQTICGVETQYKPGHWFNSAKFFDVEYQTYGNVHGSNERPKEEAHFHWRHAKKNICVTIAYHRFTRQFLGINSFGIRMRQDVFETWLNEKRSIEQVIRNLALANFDPEFYKNYEKEIIEAFNDEHKILLT